MPESFFGRDSNTIWSLKTRYPSTKQPEEFERYIWACKFSEF